MFLCRSLIAMLASCSSVQGIAQALTAPPVNPESTVSLQKQVEEVMGSVDAAEARIEAEQNTLTALRRQVAALQAELLKRSSTQPSAGAAQSVPAMQGVPSAVDVAEQQSMFASQIATLDQAKVESVSKYPLRVHGSILLNGFVNSQRVDEAAAPSAAFGGQGSTGLAMRQTSLGLDATGSRLLGAVSHADINVDFFGLGQGTGYDNGGGLLRLRTAHAALVWNRTEAYFSYDRPLISPYTPESLVSAAVPELSWSGNLWKWNPQLGVSHTWGSRRRLRAQAAVIDVSDPMYTLPNRSAALVSLAEASRRPGVEARIALLGVDEGGTSIGIGGYFAPHRYSTNAFGSSSGFDAWASTLDFRVRLPRGFSLTASTYRGQALGGLGGGGYRDFVYRNEGATIKVRPLDDVGGWTQLHHAVNQSLSWNFGLGIDNPFAQQLRANPGDGFANAYDNIARNRTVFANVLYSPRAYIIFSAEYRNLRTAPVQGRLWTSNVTALGAAYRF